MSHPDGLGDSLLKAHKRGQDVYLGALGSTSTFPPQAKPAQQEATQVFRELTSGSAAKTAAQPAPSSNGKRKGHERAGLGPD